MLNKERKKGFTLIELLVVIAIMAVLTGLLAPIMIHYVEKSHADKDTSQMGEVTAAIELGMAQQNIYDDLMMYALESNFSCYADGDPNTNTDANKVEDYNVGEEPGVAEDDDWWHYNDNARALDEVLYKPSGNMSGVTITFAHRTEKGQTNQMAINKGLVNNMSPSTKKSNATLVENLSTDTQTYLYDYLKSVVTDNVETSSGRYKCSEYTVFIRILPQNADYNVYQDTTVAVYGQWNGTNIGKADSRDPALETEGSNPIIPVPNNPVAPSVPNSPIIDPTPQIPRDPSTYVAHPTAKDLTYNTQPQILVNAGATDDGTIYYRLEDGDWSTALPTGTDAGTYEVKYYIKGDKFHYDSAEESVSVTIKKADPEYTEPQSRGLLADGTMQELVVEGSIAAGGVFYYRLEDGSYSTYIPKAKDPGEYTVFWYVKGEPSSNYNDIPEKSLLSTITGTPSISPLPEAIDLTYNGKYQTLITAGGAKGGTLYYKTTGDYSTALPQGKDAGDYTVTYYVKGDKYWNNSDEQKIDVTIKKATPVVTPPTAEALIYNGKAQLLAKQGSTTGGTLQYSLDNSTWSTTMPTGTNAGTYTLWYRVVGDANYSDVAPQSISVVIGKAIPQVYVVGNMNLQYTGSAQELLSTHTSTGGTLHYKVGSNDTWSTALPKGTNAGSYVIYYYAEETDNYLGYSSSTNPSQTTAAIAKVAAQGTVAPSVAGDVWDWDGTPHTVTPNGTGWSFAYSVDNVTFSTTKPTRTDAGISTVYWKATHENYTDQSNVANLVCNKIDATITPPSGKTLSYSGNYQELISAGSAIGGTLYYRLDSTDYVTSIPTGIDPGQYTIYWYVKGDPNYNDSSEKYVISKIIGTASISPKPEAIDLTYNGEIQTLITPGTAQNGTIYYKTTDTYSTALPQGIDAGEYIVTYYAKGAPNWDDSHEETVKVTIKKAAPIITPPTAKDLTYNGTAQALANAGSTTGGTIQYSLDNSNWSTAMPTGTNAGDYTLWYKIVGDTNYNDVEPQSISVTIKKATPKVNVVGNMALKYTGSAQELLKTHTSTGGTLHYQVGDAGTWSTTLPKATNAGSYVIYYYAEETDNYLGYSSSTNPSQTTAAIAKAAPQTAAAPSVAGYDWDWDGSMHTVTPNGTGWSFTYSEDNINFSTTKPTRTNAGTTTVNWKATHVNYTDQSGIAYLICNKAEATYSSPTGKSLTYNNSNQVLISAGSAVGGTMYYRLGNNGSWSTALPTAKEAGAYTIYYYLLGDENHYDRGSTANPIGMVDSLIKEAIVTQAIYSETDGSLTFIRDKQYNVGDSFNGKTVSEVYTGFETNTNIPWTANRLNIKKVVVVNEISPISTQAWFYGFKNCSEFDLTLLNTSQVENMRMMFTFAGQYTTTFTINGIDKWNTSSVTNMSDMFYYAGQKTTTFNLNLSGWDTSSVTDMSYMFDGSGYNAATWSIGDLSNWNTSKVTDMSYMFSNAGYTATTWNVGNLSNWNTSKVTNMRSMFEYAGFNATKFDISFVSNWNTSSVTNMSYMFERAGYNAATWSIGDLSNWNTSKVTNMNYMFAYAGYNASSFSCFDLSNWNVSKVTAMGGMFGYAGYNAKTFNIGNLENWDVSSVTYFGNRDYGYAGMFEYAGYSATTFYVGDISGWNVSNATAMSYMFEKAGTNASYYLDLSSWDVSKVTEYTYFNRGVTSKVIAPNWLY